MHKRRFETDDRRILILLARRDQAQFAQQILGQSGFSSRICADAETLAQAVEQGAGAVLIGEESLEADAIEDFREALSRQPRWSDLPVVVLLQGEVGEASWANLQRLEAFGYTTVLEKPLRPPLLISAVRAALRARRRQYRVRAYLKALRQREADLRASDTRLRRALWAGYMGVFEYDLATGTVTAAGSTERMFGLNPAQSHPLAAYLERISRQDEWIHEYALDPLRIREDFFSTELRIFGAYGLTRWLAVRGEISRDDDGNPTQISGALTDITDRKRAERDLQKLTRELELRVRELNCLYNIANLIVRRNGELEDVCGQCAAALPPAFRSPERVCARIRENGHEYVTSGFRETPYGITEEIRGRDQVVGTVEIYYLEPLDKSEPFLQEERDLITGIAKMLGNAFDRLWVENTLRESEERWRSITAVLAEGIVVQAPDGTVQDWNPSAERILEISVETLRDNRGVVLPWQIVHEDGTLFVSNDLPYNVTLRTGRACANVVMGLRKRNGQITWLTVNSRPIFHHGERGRLYAVVSSFIDITARKRAETERIRESEAREFERSRLRAVLDALPVGVFIADAVGRIQEANVAASNVWGNPHLSERPDQYATDFKAWWSATGRRIEADDWALARALRNGEISVAEEIEIEARDGTHRTILNYALPIRDAASHIAGGVAVNVDISDRKRAEEEHARLAAIVNSSSEAIIGASTDGVVTSWNRGAEKLFGYTAAEIMGRTVQLLSPPHLHGEQRQIMERLMQGKTVEQYDTVRINKNGRNVDVSLTLSPVMGANGKVIGISAAVRDITERKRIEAQLQYDAFHDRLTRLPNRTLFIDRLAHVIARAVRLSERYAVFVMDIDNFKVINDSIGHLAGDELLFEFSRRIYRTLRPVDTMARFGGDEFTILLEEVEDRAAVEHVTGRIAEVLKDPFILEGQDVHVSTSIGIAMGNANYQDPDAVLRDADTALYEAKRRGKARSIIFDMHMRAKAMSRMRMEVELRRAIAEQTITVAYQPIIDLANDKVVGCEALARWYHAQLGNLEPRQFISLAEDTGLIIPLGKFVLETACLAMADWRRRLTLADDFYVSVNLSTKQFFHGDLVALIKRLLHINELPGKNLRLEITESVIMKQDRLAARIIGQLRGLGIQICMDDFGTGYSSLSYLHRFPVDVLKVDQSFIQGLSERAASREIVATILGLANSLELQSIAEGAEDPVQLDQIKQMGFRWAQGFALYRPMESNAMVDLLGRTRH